MQSFSQHVTVNKPTPSFYTGRIPFESPNQQCQSTEGKSTTEVYSVSIACVTAVLWLGDRKGMWPVKNECWYSGGGNLTGATCKWFPLFTATTTTIISSCSKIQEWLDILTGVIRHAGMNECYQCYRYVYVNLRDIRLDYLKQDALLQSGQNGCLHHWINWSDNFLV